MPLRLSAALVPLIFAGAAFALPGTQSTDVMKRLRLMTQIRDTSTTLGSMARGETTFDADHAGRLASKLRADVAAIPIHFEFQVIDAGSRARPLIWADWSGFEEAAARTEAAAAALRTDTPEQLGAGIKVLEQSCQNCHRRYRLAD
ncbi:c-type cytochrome [Puniceibacterium sediminis]|uniref:Cytochrome c556 n=1 Tax=Puniceibacterium sediminis TaxID=1608407 RepID=A0A238VFL9_9RHOB|nr:cytochrome c [Puniceibacterium sediminis]SNR33185.1 Cytochrome c556 [Puniceibacterium sediminis]